MIGFLDVALRGLALAAQAVALGGVAFLLVVLRTEPGPAAARARARSAALAAAAAATLAAIQALLLALHVSALAGGEGWPVDLAASTGFFRAGAARAAAAVALALLVRGLGGRASTARGAGGLVLSAAITAAAALMSHAAGRVDGRAALVALDMVHQAAAAVWLGGLAHLVVTVARDGGGPWPAGLLARFSALALAAVGALIAAGGGLLASYVDGPAGLVGTSYGLMMLTKLAIFAVLLVLGGLNFLAVRRAGRAAAVPSARVRWFVEVELGLGLTAVFVAASLTSLPPAADVIADRATPAEVALRFAPGWPRLSSPALADMPVEDRAAPRTAADRAWSDYNHNVAGAFVLLMGALAALHALGGVRWARHWPLVFLPLALFMLVRSDPGSWPLGPVGFWEGWRYPEVFQHRLFVLVVVGFGLFEWTVRTGRARSPRWAYVFPALSAVGGALLLTHSHALGDLKGEFLTEVTHAPLGLLALAVGWGRWLELRLGPPDDRVPRRVWAGALVLVGALLLLYHESW